MPLGHKVFGPGFETLYPFHVPSPVLGTQGRFFPPVAQALPAGAAADGSADMRAGAEQSQS